jgi:putative ABC transport system permease protein
VRGVLNTEGFQGQARNNIVVMDIATAQQALGRLGRLDRIDVMLPPGAQLEDWEPRLRQALAADVTIARQGSRTDENRRMLNAFRWNLQVLSYISLVVGAFLIYNTMSVSVVRRRAEIGMMRALGATRRGVLLAFLAEAAFFGALGALLGLALGRALAEGAVDLIGATVRALYVSSTPGEIETTWGTALVAAAAGVGVSLLAALGPAREAARVAPTEAMARGRHEHQARLRVGRDLAWAAALAIGAGLASMAPPVAGMPLFGYLAALLLIAAAALATPAVITAVTRLAAPAARKLFGAEGVLATSSLRASLARTSVLVAALATAVSMLVSVGIMVGSYRETVTVWLDQRLRADFYLRPAGPAEASRHPVLDPAVADAIEALPEVQAVDRFRSYPISYNGLPATLGSGQSEVLGRLGNLRFLEGPDVDEVLAEMRAGDTVIVSEPFSNKHGVHPGDSITLPLSGRQVAFRIAAVYYDYSNEKGFIIADRSVMLKYLPDPAPTNIAVYLEPGVPIETGLAALERVTAGKNLYIATNRRLRAGAMQVFDRTFAITYALEAVAILVAIMGMAGALLALVIDRRREIGVLRFLGASAGQIRRMILFESGFLGLLANLVGLGLGALLSLILIYVVNKQSFGWTIQFHWPIGLLFSALTLVYLASVAAGVYPAHMAVRLNPIEVTHEE